MFRNRAIIFVIILLVIACGLLIRIYFVDVEKCRILDAFGFPNAGGFRERLVIDHLDVADPIIAAMCTRSDIAMQLVSCVTTTSSKEVRDAWQQDVDSTDHARHTLWYKDYSIKTGDVRILAHLDKRHAPMSGIYNDYTAVSFAAEIHGWEYRFSHCSSMLQGCINDSDLWTCLATDSQSGACEVIKLSAKKLLTCREMKVEAPRCIVFQDDVPFYIIRLTHSGSSSAFIDSGTSLLQ